MKVQDEKTTVVERELEIGNAKVESFGNVTTYKWDETMNAYHSYTWRLPSDRTVINGGIHVHGWKNVYMTDSYPPYPTQWMIGAHNTEGSKVDVTVYLIVLT